MSDNTPVIVSPNLPTEAYSSDELSKYSSKIRFSLNDIQREVSNRLKGRILTLVDATFTDPDQRKAFKDIINMNFAQTQDQFGTLAYDAERGMFSASNVK